MDALVHDPVCMPCSLMEKERKAGNLHDVNAAMSNVIDPPAITDGTSPSNLAARPLSKAPISLDAPMNMPFTAETLPRISSGVSN